MNPVQVAEIVADDKRLSGRRRRLVNEFQRDFPLSAHPFRDVAARLDWGEREVISALAALKREGVVSRVGPVIRPNTVGVSTLAAMAVPASRLEEVAAVVNRHPEVNHNYEREHRFNLWFVVTAGDAKGLKATMGQIETESGLPVMALPLLDDYYIDLGFDLDGGGNPGTGSVNTGDGVEEVDALDRRILGVVQSGLSLAPRPYATVAEIAGTTEDEVLRRIGSLIEVGVVKRLGVIVRHHECGYRHNAMVVWDVPDHAVHEAGRRLAGLDVVRLCYRRPRRRPEWPYNLFCMIHGRDRQTVREQIFQSAEAAGLEDAPFDILFSVRRFKQRGAFYDFGTPLARDSEAVA